MTLGLLLARAGINASVLEKHEDFLRAFRGDTVPVAAQTTGGTGDLSWV